MAEAIYTLSGREVAIIAAALRQCIGWTVPSEMQRFVNVAAEQVPEGWTEADMDDVLEHIAVGWRDATSFIGLVAP